MRTSAQAASEFVNNSKAVCALYDLLIDYELFIRSNMLQVPKSRPRPKADDLIAELRVAFKRYAVEFVGEVEGMVSELRTTLKYEHEDMT